MPFFKDVPQDADDYRIEALSDLYGSAYLSSKSDGGFDVAFSSTGGGGVALGLDQAGGPNGCFWNVLTQQGHGLTFGATRSGKGVSAIIPGLLAYGGSMVVIDPKGENCFVSAQRRRDIKQRVVLLDPWNEVNRRYGKGQDIERPTRFNPLSALDPDSPDFADDCTAIADALVVDQSADPHWSNSARELISGLVAATVEAAPGRASLGDVREHICASNDKFQKLITSVVEAKPESLGARKLAGFIGGSNEVASIRSAARTQTSVLDNSRLLASMETDSEPFDLAELATGKITLYLVLPLDRLRTHGRWLRLILTLAIRAVARQAEPPKMPVMFMIDEMGTIGKLEMIEQAFGLMAGIGIRLWGFLQDLNQLQGDYPQSWETFIANAVFLQILNARDAKTSDYVSNFMGNKTLMSTKTVPGRFKMKQEIDSMYQRPLMFSAEIRTMDDDTQLILYTGSRGNFLQKRLVYYAEPRFKGLYRSLPLFPETEPEPPPPANPPSVKKGWLRSR